MINIIKEILRLYTIQIFSFLAVWLSTYYPGMDILLSLVYLAVICWEARSIINFNRTQKVLTALLWQGPAAIISLIFVTGINVPVLSNNAIFLLEFWSTPLLPLLSIQVLTFMNRPLYYYLLLTLPVLTGIYYYLLATIPLPLKKPIVKK